MEWSRTKDNFLNSVRTYLRSLSSTRNKNKKSYLSFDSHIRIPIIFNKINVTQASTQTLPINNNNNGSKLIIRSHSFLYFSLTILAENYKSNVIIRHKNRRRKYQYRFNKCLAELLKKYPPIPAHEYLVDCFSGNVT